MVDAKLNMNQLCVLIVKLTAPWAKSEGMWPAEQRGGYKGDTTKHFLVVLNYNGQWPQVAAQEVQVRH